MFAAIHSGMEEQLQTIPEIPVMKVVEKTNSNADSIEVAIHSCFPATLSISINNDEMSVS